MKPGERVVTYGRQNGVGLLKLAGTVDIFEAAALHEAATHALADVEAACLHVDLSEVERLDICAVQLLYALRRDVAASGREVSISDVPPRVGDELARAGLSLG